MLAEGLWLFDVAVLMPMTTEPTTQTLRSCMTGEPLTAEKLMPWAESQGCRIRGARVEENELSWKLSCRMNGQRSRGSGEFKIEGDTGVGEARVSFEMAGRRLSIQTDWEARRVGPCPKLEADDPDADADDGDGEGEGESGGEAPE
jgi:hypothetical protein